VPVKSVRVYTLALILSDIFAILAAFTIAYILRVQVDPRPLVTSVSALDFFTTFSLLLPFWLLTLLSLELYSPQVYQKRMKEIGKLFIASFLGILLVIGFAFVVDFPVFPARLVAIYAAVLTFVLLVIGREILRKARSIAFRFNRGIQRVMIIGSGEIANNIAQNLHETSRSGFRIVAVCGSGIELKNVKRYQSLEKALGDLKQLDIDTIIHTELFEDDIKNRRVFEAASSHHIGYSFVPKEVEFYSGNNIVDILNGYPIIYVSQTPLAGWGEFAKRLFDIFGSLVGLIIASPIILVIGIVIKVTDKGPLIYKHQRVGFKGKTFWVYKLRSMYMKFSTGSAASGKSDEQIFKEMGREDLIEEFKRNQKVAKDPRIMPIGRFTRKTSLDELPQLWNVLKGDLSLVGPRPIVKDELRHYKEAGSTFLSVKPGVTGLWQVSGRSDLDYAERVNLDIFYVQNWSFLLDIKILFRTIGVVLKKRGAQ
jgi:exopolysaccharide biosynthesis polyprenyl glycosylphosphotransferase